MKRRDLLKGLLAAPLALVGIKLAKADEVIPCEFATKFATRMGVPIVPSNFQPGQWTVVWNQDGKTHTRTWVVPSTQPKSIRVYG